MQILWKINKGFVKDILEHFDEPKPAYNTISTVVRVLEKKKMVGYIAYGKTHEYYPLLSKNEYAKTHFNGFLKNYFNSSFKKMVSFFTVEEDFSIKDLEKLKQLTEDLIKQKKGKK